MVNFCKKYFYLFVGIIILIINLLQLCLGIYFEIRTLNILVFVIEFLLIFYLVFISIKTKNIKFILIINIFNFLLISLICFSILIFYCTFNDVIYHGDYIINSSTKVEKISYFENNAKSTFVQLYYEKTLPLRLKQTYCIKSIKKENGITKKDINLKAEYQKFKKIKKRMVYFCVVNEDEN